MTNVAPLLPPPLLRLVLSLMPLAQFLHHPIRSLPPPHLVVALLHEIVLISVLSPLTWYLTLHHLPSQSRFRETPFPHTPGQTTFRQGPDHSQQTTLPRFSRSNSSQRR